MPDSAADLDLRVEVLSRVAAVDAGSWDALAGDDDPFVEHAFLKALETSGSVGGNSGWEPVHVTVWRADRLVGALPLYLKLHSYGEYIFDWSWAGAAERAGIRYYPKLLSMVPFTPATGRRVLYAPDADPPVVAQALMQGVSAIAEEVKASSLHVLFLTDQERSWLRGTSRLMSRVSCQYHWHNDGYESFDDFLGTFRSSMRKQVRRERRQVRESGLEVRLVPGPELADQHWSALKSFYLDTCYRKGSTPYLTPEFFDEIRAHHAHRVVAALALRGGDAVAGTLNFEKGRHLYGRYWGCLEDYDGLHFELCYYQLIERAIERGMARFEAGAQGSHKIRRGLMPSEVYSVHWIAHAGLSAAVDEFLDRERQAVREHMGELAMHGPFRRG